MLHEAATLAVWLSIEYTATVNPVNPWKTNVYRRLCKKLGNSLGYKSYDQIRKERLLPL